MRQTMQEFGRTTDMGATNTLGKAGATTIGFNRTQNSTRSASSIAASEAGKPAPTSHWKTTY